MKAEDLLFSIPFPSVITDGEGKIVTSNQKFESLLGRSLKHLKGKELSSFFSEKQDLKEKLVQAYSQGLEILGFRLGNYYFNLSPLYDSSSISGVFVLIQPVVFTSLNEELHLFLKGLSHEIGNPLSGIKGAAKLFYRLKSYDEELVEVLIRETERIERLLNHITEAFDFTSLNLVKVNVHKLLQDVTELFREKLLSSGIEVKTNFDPSLPEVLLDPDRIKQAFINIFKNAIEAVEGENKKTIVVETGYSLQPSGYFFVKFRDSGSGMDADTLKRYSLPFFSKKEEGSGLGTFIAKEIVEAHSGELQVRSEVGKGTEVTLLLPLKR